LNSQDVQRRIATTSYRMLLGYAPAFANPNVDHAGWIEDGPHGLVHLWTGDPSLGNPPKPDMGVLSTAAQDPVFFSHHSNIDRLWDVWVRKGNQQPVASSWRDQKFYFYDDKTQWVSMTVEDTLNLEDVRYRYDGSAVGPLATMMKTDSKETTLTPEP